MWKITFREIKRTFGRYLTILAIIALGVGMVVGLKITRPVMIATVSDYVNEQNFYDYELLSTLGFTEDDVEVFSRMSDVQTAVGAISTDVLYVSGDDELVLKFLSITDGVNDSYLLAGRMPENANECVVDSRLMSEDDIGSVITIAADNDEDTLDMLVYDEYEVVGIIENPLYLNFERGTTSVGSGQLSGYVFIMEDGFDTDYYTAVYIKYNQNYEIYSDEYDDFIDAHEDEVDEILSARVQLRYDTLVAEAEEKIADGESELADGEAEVADAKSELADAESEVADAIKELTEGESELTDGQEELVKSESELADAKQELEEGESELADAKAQAEEGESELADAIAQLEEAESELADAREQLSDGESELAAKKSEYEAQFADAKASLDEAQQTIDEQESELVAAEAALEEAESELAEQEQLLNDTLLELADAQATITASSEELAVQKAALETSSEELAAQEETVSASEAELAETQELLAAQRTQLDAAKEELAAQKAELETQKSELEAAIAELQAQLDAASAAQAAAEEETAATGSSEIQSASEISGESSGQTETEALTAQIEQLKESLAAVEAGLSEIAATEETLAASDAELTAAEEQAASAAEELAAGRAQIDAAKAELAAGEAQIAAAEEELSASQTQVTAGKEEAEAGLVQLEAAKEELAAQSKTLADARVQLEEGKETLAASKAEYEEGVASYDKEIAEAEAELETARNQIAEAEAEIESGWQEVADGRAELDDAWQAIAEAEAELADGWQKVTDGQAELADGWQKFYDSQDTISDGWQDVADAQQEITDAYQEIADAEAELADGYEELADARQELADLEATQYLLGRDSNVGYVSFESDSMIVDNVAAVFPVFFFLVAILICMTTMNRMVDEGRTQIGVLKALGYSKFVIAWEYIFYALSAAVVGSLIGFAAGSTLFPTIIWAAYGIMYDVAGIRLVFSAGWLIFSILTAFVCSVGATMFTCYVEFASVPANLMRPRSPQSGKRVFLEYVTPVWKRLNFLQKVSVRNVLRYKKRLLMMVLGVSGCTALIIAANGLKDSCTHIADSQYDQIQTYDIETVLDDGADEEEMERLREAYSSTIDSMMFVCENSVDLVTDDLTKEVTAVVAQDDAQMADFWKLFDSKGNSIGYPGESEAVLTKKTASRLGISVGDTLTVRNDDGKSFTVTITGIAVNYVYNYIYISKETYEAGFGEEPEYKYVCMQTSDGADIYEAAADISNDDNVLQITVTEDNRQRISNMMDSLDAVIALVFACAAALAFIVMYNLTNINIIEREREIATIKVLGFYPGETAQYVFRENLMLTVVGVLVGLGLGKWLHAFIMGAIDVDFVTFDLIITVRSYLLSVVMTLVFAVLVDVVMYFRLDKINMAESLKSIE